MFEKKSPNDKYEEGASCETGFECAGVFVALCVFTHLVCKDSKGEGYKLTYTEKFESELEKIKTVDEGNRWRF